MIDSEEELKSTLSMGLFFATVPDCMCHYLLTVNTKTDLFHENGNSDPMVSVAREIVQFDPYIPIQFLVSVIEDLSRVVAQAFNNFKDKYTLEFFHERRKLIRSCLKKWNTESDANLIWDGLYEGKNLLVEAYWAVTLHDAFCNRVCAPSRKTEEKAMLRTFISRLVTEMFHIAEKMIYRNLKGVIRKGLTLRRERHLKRSLKENKENKENKEIQNGNLIRAGIDKSVSIPI
jgi:16S rRNA A1518/A1519 N6-dimethyltransferase RsmA/KsgA/DIM1 with predicted DNA glycosylase/AP lyase activity